MQNESFTSDDASNDEEYIVENKTLGIKWQQSYSSKHNTKVLIELTGSFSDLLKNKYNSKAMIVWEDIKAKRIIEKHLIIEKSEILRIEIEEKYSDLIQTYSSVHNFRLKRQLLSLIAKKYELLPLSKAFNCTEWQVKKAREHASNIGPGQIFEITPYFKEKLDEHLIDSFLEFITSQDYMQDIAHGHKIIKLSNNINLLSPDTIRLATNKQIFDDYKSLCQSEGVKYLSEMTCCRILNICSASKRKSLQGNYNFGFCYLFFS
jgi:hypothetical protein